MQTLKLKLGTRKSLLAWSQSSWVARSIEAKNPGVHVELVGIETQGDKILDKPLSQIEGKEFFTAELDHALLRGEVDLTVHSMKDLSLERPPQIKLAATPKRELQNDIIVFHSNVIERLKRGEEIRVGTSSPRRLTLVPDFLKNALPRFSLQGPRIRFVEIRGNVNTRLSRIHEPETSDRKLDAVVLAFAGLERLAIDEKAAVELWKLFENTLMMITPLKECPSAPAQGALAIEARADHTTVLELIGKLHDPKTLEDVTAEREVLNEWGGGCHQKLGASAVNGVIHIKGQKKSGEFVTELRGEKLASPDFTRIESTDVFNFSAKPLTAEEQRKLNAAELVFIAHTRAYEYLSQHSPQLCSFENKRVWVSGTKSWFKMASAGVWVEGSLEGRGYEFMQEFRQKKLLRMGDRPFAFLTHAESESMSAVPALTEVIATYQHQFREIPKKLAESERIYWTSGLPFQTIWGKLSTTEQSALKLKQHACGPGKTAAILKAQGITPEFIRE